MFINHLAGFTRFIEDNRQPQMFTTTVTRDYLGQNFYWNGSTFPITNPGGVTIVDANGKRRTLQAGTDIGIEKNFAKNLTKEPDANQKVPVVIGNLPDVKIPTQSNTAHGKPSEYGGQSFTVPYSTFVWMIQPPNSAGGAGAMGGMGGMPGMPGLGAMPGAAPTGGTPGMTPSPAPTPSM